ncbi:hypothetical protein GCM10009815_08000 [Nocardioides marmoribigeumensis]
MTDGQRTLRRVELARSILGFDAHAVVNIFAIPSHATGALGTLGVAESGWIDARREMCAGLAGAKGVLLGYGSSPPSGAARAQFRGQVDWLASQLSELAVPVWQFGDGPRHPSRWQRWTHRAYPGIGFEEAVRRSLVLVDPESTIGAHQVLI